MKVYVEVARGGVAAFWLGGLSGLTIFLVTPELTILSRILYGAGMFLFLFFITGYFHLIFISNKRYFHFYNWMLLPLFSTAKWKNIESVSLVSYDRSCLEDMSETMMVMHGNCSPIEQTALWPAAKNKTLNEKLINYINVESELDMHDFPLEVFRQPNHFLNDVLERLKGVGRKNPIRH